jgi:hypothetical protein
MKISNHQEAVNTRAKLVALEGHYLRACERKMDTEELHQLTLHSLRQMINQLKEELIRFECDVKAGRVASAVSV